MTPSARTAQNGAALRWAVYAVVRRTTRDDARRGAIYDARYRSGKTYTDETRRHARSATTHARGRHECRPYANGGFHMHG